MQVIPYLYFNGRCDEALDFYQSKLGAELQMKMRFSESPDPPPPGMIPPGFENKVMHSTFRLGNSVVMASDGTSQEPAMFKGVTLSLQVDSVEEAERKFAALSEGGKVQMPLMQTFFSDRWGMVADRFGVNWMVLVTPKGS